MLYLADSVTLATVSAVLLAVHKHLAHRAVRAQMNSEPSERVPLVWFFAAQTGTAATLSFAGLLFGTYGSGADLQPLARIDSILLAVLNGIAVLSAIVLRSSAVSRLPSSLVEPLYRSSVLLQVLWGLAFLGEAIGSSVWGMLAAATSVVLVLGYAARKAAASSMESNPRARSGQNKGLALAVGAAVAAATAGVCLDAASLRGYAASSGFLAVAYCVGFFLLPLVRFTAPVSKGNQPIGRTTRDCQKLGLAAGVAMYGAGLALMSAYQVGSFVVVSCIIATHSVLAVGFDAAAWRDQRASLSDWRVVGGLVMMVASLLLLKLAN